MPSVAVLYIYLRELCEASVGKEGHVAQQLVAAVGLGGVEGVGGVADVLGAVEHPGAAASRSQKVVLLTKDTVHVLSLYCTQFCAQLIL